MSVNEDLNLLMKPPPPKTTQCTFFKYEALKSRESFCVCMFIHGGRERKCKERKTEHPESRHLKGLLCRRLEKL